MFLIYTNKYFKIKKETNCYKPGKKRLVHACINNDKLNACKYAICNKCYLKELNKIENGFIVSDKKQTKLTNIIRTRIHNK